MVCGIKYIEPVPPLVTGAVQPPNNLFRVCRVAWCYGWWIASDSAGETQLRNAHSHAHKGGTGAGKGALPVSLSSRCFSIKRFSKTVPDDGEMTGSSGTLPETKRNKHAHGTEPRKKKKQVSSTRKVLHDTGPRNLAFGGRQRGFVLGAVHRQHCGGCVCRRSSAGSPPLRLLLILDQPSGQKTKLPAFAECQAQLPQGQVVSGCGAGDTCVCGIVWLDTRRAHHTRPCNLHQHHQQDAELAMLVYSSPARESLSSQKGHACEVLRGIRTLPPPLPSTTWCV